MFCKLIIVACFMLAVSANSPVIRCLTPNTEIGYCISLFSCPILMKSLGTLQTSAIAFVKASICQNPVPGDVLVCCGSLGNFLGLKLHPEFLGTTPPTLNLTHDVEKSPNVEIYIPLDSTTQMSSVEPSKSSNSTEKPPGVDNIITNSKSTMNGITNIAVSPLQLPNDVPIIAKAETTTPPFTSSPGIPSESSSDITTSTSVPVSPLQLPNDVPIIAKAETTTLPFTSPPVRPSRSSSDITLSNLAINSSKSASVSDLTTLKPIESSSFAEKAPNISINTSLSKSEDQIKAHRDFVKRNLLPSRKYCGLQHTDDRFYFENATALDEFPWLVHITLFEDYEDDAFEYLNRCNGVLINRRYVLTSGYCGIARLTVRLGQYYTNETVSCIENPHFPECTEPWLKVTIEETIYRINIETASSPWHDYALLRLDKNVTCTDFIRPICLPLDESDIPKDDDYFTLSGWGGVVKIGAMKKRMFYNLTDLDVCYNLEVIEKYTYNQEGKELKLAPPDVTPLCLEPKGEGGEMICIGDHGGPLMYSKRHQWFAYGIITRVYYYDPIGDFHPNWCSNVLPITGVKITENILNWILDNMRP